MIRDVPADRWREAGALFHELVELDAPSRSERLARVGDSDPELRSAVEALLAGDAIAGDALPTLGFGLGALTQEDAGDALGIAGQTFGRFHVLDQIAWGGMGVVYRAEDLQLHRTVALKFPLLDRGVSDAARALSLREARSAGALDHPNVCPIYDVGESAHGPYFVMPLYGGETLKDRIARAAPLDVAESLAIVEQLAAGLTCAHEAGIVHCDIKPGNIMLLPDGTVKLLDFGLARAAAADSSAPGPVVGTIAYMAPEQLRNEPVDARADLWALGVILYEMLCGARPFVGDGAEQIVKAALESQPLPLAERGVTIPAAAQELVDGLLEKDPRARLETATDLKRAVESARGAISGLRTRRRTIRRFVAAGAAVAGIAVLVLWLRPTPTLIGTGKLSPHDTVVLADFDVRGSDPGIAAVLDTLLRRDFVDSKGVSLMPVRDVSSALVRMRQRPGTSLTPELARQLALREEKRAVLSGALSPIKAGYVVRLRLIAPENGNDLVAFEDTVRNPERELLPALTRQSRALRHAIGESPGDAKSVAPRSRKPLTTTSLDAAVLAWATRGTPRSAADKIRAARAATVLDSTFAYAWMSIGNMLAWTEYRSAMLDSAFKKAYQLRADVTLMEQAQISGLYWRNLYRDRRRALTEMDSALAVDTTIHGSVALNTLQLLVETRQFERAESFGRRIERWKTVNSGATGDLVRSQVAQGKYADAESSIARRRSLLDQGDLGSVAPERLIQLSELRFDSAEVIFQRMLRGDDEKAALYRLRGRLADAHRLEARIDSTRAADAAAAGARFDSVPGVALTLAREALWLNHDPAAAIAQLDAHWRDSSPTRDIQDRIEGIQAAALYAAAGRPSKARALLAAFEGGADTIAKRGIYEYRHSALAEIALAEGKFSEAMTHFRASDVAADGLPASPCSVCVLPHLARVAERAGWSDSARVFWEGYVSRPAIERLSTDQWFLTAAYSRLAALAAKRGDSEGAATYHGALTQLRATVSARAR